MSIQRLLVYAALIVLALLTVYCAFTGEKITNFVDKQFILELLDKIKDF